uniref:Uncharacterized protein n=1 Tax=Mola mola TaxID=94237 RepID=A0A3Q4A9A9_MOLML
MSHLLLYRCLCSSDPSPQSLSPSHTHTFEMHLLLSHVKVGQFVSSEASPQSSMPSQFHSHLIFLLLWDWNIKLLAHTTPSLWAFKFMIPVIPCLIIMFPPPSLFLISNIALVLVSDTYRKSSRQK